MSNVNEERMKKAFPNVPVPKELQEKMLQREKAVVMGRRAEKLLNEKTTSAEKSEDMLMAQAMVGRMALTADLPKGATPEKIAQTLQNTEGFKTYRKQSPEAQRKDLNSGAFMKALVPQKSTAHAQTSPQKAAAPVEKGKAL